MTELSRVKKRKSQEKRKKTRKLNYKRIVFSLVLLGLFFFVFLGAGFKFADAMFAHFIPNKPVVAEDGDKDNENIENKKLSKGPINILVLGTDQRKNEPARSDTMILAVLFPEKEEVRLLAIPRDTKVKIPGRRNMEKITHAHAYGGVELAKETVEDFLDLPIHYYVRTNFQGFKNIIDILGGITLDVERRMYKPTEDIDLKPGLQNLNGHDALAYVRFRDDGRGDIGRVERQEKFIKALGDHAVSISTVWKIPKLLKEVKDNVTTDLGATEMLYLATKYANIDGNNIKTHMLPGEPTYTDGISYYIADSLELEKLLDKIQSSKAIEPEENEEKDKKTISNK